MIPIKDSAVEYACICSLGKLRRNNEDNYYCDGSIREDIYSNDEASAAGTVPSGSAALFAVFDGMGGEACGEIASYTAAYNTKQLIHEGSCPCGSLSELAHILDEKVREETGKRSLVLMGTTIAALRINGGGYDIMNAGDSRVYKLSQGELRQLSADHTVQIHRSCAITEFLGKPEGRALHPYTASGKIDDGDIFLLCSDGVTDMLSDSEIGYLLSRDMSAENICRSVADCALDKGGIDNITAVVLRIVGC